MVKSYRGVQAAPEVEKEAQKVTVADYMSTRLITFRPEQSIDEVINVLLKNKISGGPVVDENNQLCGVISEGDCLKEVVRGKYNNSPNMSGTVADHIGAVVVLAAHDFLEAVVRGKYNNSPNMSGTVADHMAKEVITIAPETNIFDAAQKFLTLKIRRFPVLRHGQLVGQISQKDIMKAVVSLQGETWGY